MKEERGTLGGGKGWQDERGREGNPVGSWGGFVGGSDAVWCDLEEVGL